ncbi:MAG: hypothetical protein U9N41_01675 [Euryarchaeota archaeon]|nr:hypothetical protein [Euryarchaeota archaeon]
MGILAEGTGRMENEVRRHFDEIIEDAKAALEDVEIEQDYSVKRALLKISGNFRNLKVRITEVIDEDKRKYTYYLINKDLVVIGFDNAPDIKALKIKYGKDYKYHLDERIPHFHGKGKKSTELTKEITFREFLEKVKLLKEEQK